MFDRAVTVLRIRGIPIKLHFTLLLFLPYVAFVAASQFSWIASSLGIPREALHLPPIVWGCILAVGLFVAILAHELAHSLVAIQHGVRVRSITLMMLGGVSQIEGEDPRSEAWMAFAGPLMSFGIALVSYVVYRLLPGTTELGVALLAFAITNAILGAFNLLPAFPMDGGRVLRGLLAGRLGHERATRVATGIGRVMAVVFGVVGLVSFNLILVLIAVFVFMAATAEQARTGARGVIRGIPIAKFMTDRIGEADADESARAVAERLLRDNLVGVRVHDALAAGGPRREIGVLTAWDLARRLEPGLPVSVGAAMSADLPRVHVGDDAVRTIEAVATGEARAVAVLDEAEHVVGLVTPSEIQRVLALVGALQAAR